jgi:hypothetical protein
MGSRVFLLSPANSGGIRAGYLIRPQATFELARRLQSAAGAPLGEVFRFASGLYFRGKLAYARAFARPPRGVHGALVIAPGYGLVSVDEPVRVDDLLAFAKVPIDEDDPRYREPLLRDAAKLARKLRKADEVVLLGSVASAKYTSILLEVFGDRLMFPPAFVGRGDMSRGGLMLRSAADGEELLYAAVRGAAVHGKRPPRLPKRSAQTGSFLAPRARKAPAR